MMDMKRGSTRKNLAGMTFGRLSVLSFVGKNKWNRALWLCACECGTQKVITGRRLLTGDTQSCGCLLIERRTKHGFRNHPLYATWQNMIARCSNQAHPSYKYYGGRGIVVCDEWRNIAVFIADMAPTFTKGMTIDRINNSGPYCKNNCRWATPAQQARNSRQATIINIDGDALCIKDACAKLGISYSAVMTRISRKGMTNLEAIYWRKH